jgi:hypothetical protein
VSDGSLDLAQGLGRCATFEHVDHLFALNWTQEVRNDVLLMQASKRTADELLVPATRRLSPVLAVLAPLPVRHAGAASGLRLAQAATTETFLMRAVPP